MKHHGSTWVRESMHSDFGHVCRQGCPESPQWDGVLELDSAEKERDTNTREQCRRSAGENEGENLENHPKLMIDSALWNFGAWFPLFSRWPFCCTRVSSSPTAKDTNSGDLSWEKKGSCCVPPKQYVQYRRHDSCPITCLMQTSLVDVRMTEEISTTDNTSSCKLKVSRVLQSHISASYKLRMFSTRQVNMNLRNCHTFVSQLFVSFIRTPFVRTFSITNPRIANGTCLLKIPEFPSLSMISSFTWPVKPVFDVSPLWAFGTFGLCIFLLFSWFFPLPVIESSLLDHDLLWLRLLNN